jgi:hypothetical protein
MPGLAILPQEAIRKIDLEQMGESLSIALRLIASRINGARN